MTEKNKKKIEIIVSPSRVPLSYHIYMLFISLLHHEATVLPKAGGGGGGGERCKETRSLKRVSTFRTCIDIVITQHNQLNL